ncbi:MAG: glycosyltransferase family 2 protein [Cetobacterium sp.]
MISVVIPCYNQQKYLDRCLSSLINQGVEQLDVIVVDDGSNEPVIIKKENYPYSINLIRQKNQGLASARNVGIRQSKGRLIKFLDADDELLPNCLKKQKSTMGNFSDAISIIGYYEQHEKFGITSKAIPAFCNPIAGLLLANLAPVHAYLFNKKSLIDIGGFDVSERTKFGCEDYDLVMRLALSGCQFISVHDYGAIYHKYIVSMSTSRERMQYAVRQVWLYFSNKILDNPSLINNEVFQSLLIGLCIMLDYGKNYFDELINKSYITLIHRIKELFIHSNDICLFNECFSRSFYNKIIKYSEMEPLLSIFDSNFNEKIKVNHQEIIDYRIRLLDYSNLIDPSRMISFLTKICSSETEFAIYGCSDIGGIYLSFAKSVGREPRFFIDRNFHSIKNYMGYDVKGISEVDKEKKLLIVIASNSSYNEIHRSITKAMHEHDVI